MLFFWIFLFLIFLGYFFKLGVIVCMYTIGHRGVSLQCASQTRRVEKGRVPLSGRGCGNLPPKQRRWKRGGSPPVWMGMRGSGYHSGRVALLRVDPAGAAKGAPSGSISHHSQRRLVFFSQSTRQFFL